MLPFNPTWKIATYGMGVLLIASVAANGLQKWSINSLTEQLARSEANLVTARNNAATLELSLAEQTIANEKLAEESKRRTEAAAKQLAEAQKRTRVVERRVDVLRDRPIEGSTLEQRVLDVDGMVLENIK